MKCEQASRSSNDKYNCTGTRPTVAMWVGDRHLLIACPFPFVTENNNYKQHYHSFLAEVCLTFGEATPIYRRGWSLVRRWANQVDREECLKHFLVRKYKLTRRWVSQQPDIDLHQERVVFHYSGLLEANQFGGYISRTGQVPCRQLIIWSGRLLEVTSKSKSLLSVVSPL